MEGEKANVVWHWMTRVVFRFFFVYWTLFCADFILAAFSSILRVTLPFRQYFNPLVGWIGVHWFHLPENTMLQSPSGDALINYVQIFCYFLLSASVALVWTILDRRRSEYVQLNDLLRVLLRYFLFSTLITYGFSKVFNTQFSNISLVRLIEPYGDSSPKTLLWTFMGYSGPYTIFGGACEVLGGVLLLWRRTTTLGALICAGVMANVVLLNLCYDVPVKLLSSHLFLISLFLVVPDLKRLVGFFVLNRPVEAAPMRRVASKKLYAALLIVKALFVGWTGYTVISLSVGNWRQFGSAAPLPRFYGAWQVESFQRDGKDVPPLFTDAPQWRRVTIDKFAQFGVQSADGTVTTYSWDIDEQAKTITVGPYDWRSEEPKTTFKYLDEPGRLTMEGSWQGSPIKVRLKSMDLSTFTLLGRGFHWVSDRSFNK